ncbi:ankyrin repeat domain-containing protein [Actinoplanes sp. LDG1-06]|uniref:Ankyrin repeat domain-containing protein n=1 Tax=Paractinoplanes ovalisporus TaxID=2810368 RepID=A0ABS2A5L6_9ACTN|nr:ankyrin repeat domain-containing protein [Actinoplanes ovalisporus]MBM2614588.1 ankyrin repeat domain-containing protein [Actinoplanes ovalisporus]
MKRRRRKKLQRQLVERAGWGEVHTLLRAGAEPDTPDRDGSTALYRASVSDRVENVRALLSAGADPNLESGTGDEGLPLCGAACWGHRTTVAMLLDAGADPERREDHGQGRTAIEWAEAGGYHDTVDRLRAGLPAR